MVSEKASYTKRYVSEHDYVKSMCVKKNVKQSEVFILGYHGPVMR